MNVFRDIDDELFDGTLYGHVRVSWEDFDVESEDWQDTLACTYPAFRRAGRPIQINLNR